FKVKKIPDKIPYVFFVSRYKVIKEKDKLLKELASNEFNPTSEILFQEDPPKAFKNSGSGSINNNLVRVIKNTPDKIELEAQTKQDGFIFISELFYPGWKVFTDGVESKILKANYIFRAVSANKGKHSIVFVYKPESFKIGMVIYFKNRKL
ncbi:MAG: YfhO family protein, partial [Armatimonadetes bacterium]|nr:YfhO family protein [Armatimonadota bacterium]